MQRNWRPCKMVELLWKSVVAPQKIKNRITLWPIHALSSITHNSWNVEATQGPRCMTDGWSIHTRGYYSALKRKAFPTRATNWMNLGEIMLRERSQDKKTNLSQKDKLFASTSHGNSVQLSSVQWLSCVRLFATPWIAARQASLSITNSRSSLRLTSIESVMPSSHLILCHHMVIRVVKTIKTRQQGGFQGLGAKSYYLTGRVSVLQDEKSQAWRVVIDTNKVNIFNIPELCT